MAGEPEEYTSLKVTKKLTSRLKDMGKKGESYEDIIWRLIDGRDAENSGLSGLAEQIRELENKIKGIKTNLKQEKKV